MLKVIIADDERLVREGIKIILKEENLPVEIIGEARNGQEAFELISGNIPDIVITDIRMPVMDGINLIRKVKSLSQSVRFIIISGFAEFEYARSALELGVTNYVLKPIKNEELSAAINKAGQEIEKIKSIISETEKKQVIEKENLNMFMEKSLNALLFGQEQAAEVRRRICERVPELKEAYFMLGIFHIDHPGANNSGFDENDFDLMRFSIKNILDEVCENNAICFGNFKDKAELFVLSYDSREHFGFTDSSRFIYDIFMKINSVIPISVTVGVSDIHRDITNLPESYKEAKLALDRRFFCGEGTFYRYKDVRALSQKGFNFPEHKLQTLKICLEWADLERGMDEIEKIIGDIFSADSLAQAAPIHLKMLFVETVRVITIFCERMGLSITEFISENAASGEILTDFSNSRDIEKYIVNLIIRILESVKPASKDTKMLVRRIEDYLKSDFHKEISLDELARQYKVNVKYLSRLFKNTTGRNFSDYLSEIRLNKAKELLEKTQLTVYDIAISVGYGDPQYFHRVFKKYYGVTPNEFRVLKSEFSA